MQMALLSNTKRLPNTLINALTLNTLAKQRTNLIILDATWTLPSAQQTNNHPKTKIPNARFFDIDKHSNQDLPYPHMLPTETQFKQVCEQLGIYQSTQVVIYDGSVPFYLRPSCRVWWTFVALGFPKSHVSVLDGGLDAWIRAGLPVVSAGDIKENKDLVHGDPFVPKVQLECVVDYEQLSAGIHNKQLLVLDARPKGRFEGQDPEPRQGIQSGHMPNAINVPSSSLFDATTGQFKSVEDLKSLFTPLITNHQQGVVTTCGSGITAAVLSFAMEYAGVRNNVPVYDGSWSEYASKGSKIEMNNFK